VSLPDSTILQRRNSSSRKRWFWHRKPAIETDLGGVVQQVALQHWLGGRVGDHCERDEAVHAGVIAVGDHGRAVETPPRSQPDLCSDLVTD
jgi:hypothetical protein